MALDRCRPVMTTSVPSSMRMVQTPLSWQEWARSLTRHPDRRFRSYIIEGIRDGFRVGLQYSKSCKPAKQNRPATDVEQGVVREYLAKECAEGRVLGPLPPESLPQVQISPIRVIPKSTPGKWRLIVNLSAPEPRSVNDGLIRIYVRCHT